MGAIKKEPGAASARVAANLRRIRMTRGMSTYALSARLAGIGSPIRPNGITYIETGARRVDVDDLLALAVALGCSPNRLLLPADPGGDCDLVTPETRTATASAWAWATGEHPLILATGTGPPSGVDAALFRIENGPHHLGAGAVAGETSG